MNNAATRPFQGRLVAIWVLRILLGLLFLSTGLFKLTSQPMMVAEFDLIGLGRWFLYFTGALELAGGIAVMVPRVSRLGAGVLLLVTAGAFVAQLAVLHMDWIHPIVIGALLVLVIYLQRPSDTLA